MHCIKKSPTEPSLLARERINLTSSDHHIQYPDFDSHCDHFQDQYMFVHTAVNEGIQAQECVYTQQEFSAAYRSLIEKDKNTNTTKLSQQFKVSNIKVLEIRLEDLFRLLIFK